MRSRIKRKLNSRAGESIAETLVSLLVASLALVMLAGTLTTSSGIIMKAKTKLNEYYDANDSASGVVKMEKDGIPTTIEGVTIKDESGTCSFNQYFKVTYFKNDKFGKKVVIAYKPASTSE